MKKANVDLTYLSIWRIMVSGTEREEVVTMVNVMSKQDAMTGRLSLRVFPEIVDAVGLETMRLRREGLKFGERTAKQTVIVMTAIEEFLSLPEEVRNKLYLKRVEQYEQKLESPHEQTFAPLQKRITTA